MKRKIRCIYIDGIERSGKTSITREMRKFLKENEKDLHEFELKSYGIQLHQQNIILEENKNAFVLKKGSLMSLFYSYVRDYSSGPQTLEEDWGHYLRQEKEINHNYGAVHFFLIPEDKDALTRIFGGLEEVPDYMKYVVDFYKNINLYNMTQGLDIRLITFDEHDRIYDVRDKILKLLEEEYKI